MTSSGIIYIYLYIYNIANGIVAHRNSGIHMIWDSGTAEVYTVHVEKQRLVNSGKQWVNVNTRGEGRRERGTASKWNFPIFCE